MHATETLDLAPWPWTVRAAGDVSSAPGEAQRPVPAAVPGCVHTDLIAAGLIEHPNLGRAEEACAWIGRTDWRYECVFDVDPSLLDHDRIELVCDGLDTIAFVELNGTSVGAAENMHHAHRFDVRETLRPGANTLIVEFRGPMAYAEERERALGARPVNGEWGPYAYVRKAACNFGWDWGPQVPTVGIWRGIRVRAWSDVRIAAVRPLVVAARNERAIVEVAVDVARAGTGDVDVRAALTGPAGDVVEGRATIGGDAEATVIHLEVENPELWWPRGYGAQPLYRLRVALGDGLGNEHDDWTGAIGLREARLDTTPDADGSPFTLEVNGRPVFCKGANWIPEGLFPAALAPDDYRTRVQQAVDANMNMLRVWGGGIYEDVAFYDACDEQGILVWQDFMFACATYPEDDPYPTLVATEARAQITRLCRHPSIVLWCGGNENIVAYESWGWREELAPGQSWGKRYWLEDLPRIVAELDPTRPYWPDSPYSGDRVVHANDPDHGDRHTWDHRGEGCRTLVPRFASEFGHQGPPCAATWREAVGDAGFVVDGEASRHRQRAGGGNARQYDEPMAEWFCEPESFDEWLYLAHLLQARFMGIGLEWLRANRPRCMGALFWQFNDAWAGHSWSAIDVAGRPKPLWYATRRAFASRILTMHPRAGVLGLAAVNDDATPWAVSVRLRRVRFDGTVLAGADRATEVDAAGVTWLDDVCAQVGPPERPSEELIVADADGARAWWFFARDRDLEYPPADYGTVLERDGDAWTLTIEAETLVRDVVVAADRLAPGARVSDQLLTLLPGESATIRIEGADALPPDALTTPPVLLTANAFGA